MRLLAIDEDNGVTECEITSEVDDFLKAVNDTCDDEYTIADFLEDAQKEAEITLSLVDLVEKGMLSCDNPDGLREHKELAEDSLKTIEVLRGRAAELGYL